MEIHSSKRLEHFKTGIFAFLDEKRIEMEKKGRKVVNFSIGTPDFTAPDEVVASLVNGASKPETYGYTLTEIPELKDALCKYYKRRFNCDIFPDEITATNGSQEGIGHLAMALCDKGDIALLPNPGYPIFSAGAYLGGADEYYYPVLEENNYLPKLDEIPEDVLKRAKYIIVSYPSNPVCAIAPDEFYDELIAWAKKHNIIVVHDNAYSDIIYDGNIGGSFLSHEGAKDVGIEFFSLSKSFNLTGARVSFAIGNKEVVAAIKKLRSQYDFGIFRPIQEAAVTALTEDYTEFLENQRMKYQLRRDALCDGLSAIGWKVPKGKGTMFAWMPIPEKFTSSEAFCFELLEKTGVLCTPGSAFGSLGEGYVRFALTKTVEETQMAIKMIDESGILK
ncbi:MAG: aminotransferase class I/II-fold pyridoxal phosphate-dependent enzyme [Clostridia bacterium]|nr:aminotransferase class I/II-fold pyridoxal phosphate-dependent enzyme [Clostridia bacterium]